MATEPGLSEYVTTTLRKRMKIARDNITNNNALLSSMDEYGALESYGGGRTIIEEMMFAENSTFQRYSGAQILNTSLNYTMTSSEFAHKQFAVAVVMSGLEERMNSGPEGVIDLMSGRMKVAEATLENKYQQDMLSDGTADSGLQIGGLKLIVAKTPTNVVGGIDRSTTAGAFYKNFKFDVLNDVTAPAPGGANTNAGNIRLYYNYCINSLTRNNDRPTFIYAGQLHYQYIEEALDAIQRVTTDSPKVRSGYQQLVYKGIPVVLGGGANPSGETQVQADLTYFLNTKYLKMRYHKAANMEPLPEVQSINQDAVCKLVIWMGNMTSSAPFLNGVMFDS